MTKIGTLYSYPGNPRVFKAQIAAKYNGDTIDCPEFEMNVTNKTLEYQKKFPLGKVPAFEATDGFVLYESTAIAYYAASLKKDSPIMGRDVKENALIQQYLHFADNELTPNIGGWLYPLIGIIKYNKEQVSQAQTMLERTIVALDKILLTKTYLVGERITLADIVMSMALYHPFRTLFDAEYRKKFVNLTRWFVTCVNQPNFKAIIGDFKLCEEQLKYDPKKHSAAKDQKAEKKQEKKKEKKEEKPDLEAEIAAEEKAKAKEKNPLDLLPPSKFILDEWKRFYSNNDEPLSCKWFWENFDPEGYSMWRVEYKYNEELTMTFMSSNLVGGFFQRMERARKYAFGSLCILGTNNNNQISGYFIVRGNDVPFEISDAADYESYKWTKVDPSSEKTKKLWSAYISWDKVIEGLPFADGKIFK